MRGLCMMLLLGLALWPAGALADEGVKRNSAKPSAEQTASDAVIRAVEDKGSLQALDVSPNLVPVQVRGSSSSLVPLGAKRSESRPDAPNENLGRCIYSISAIDPTAQDIADAIKARLSDVPLTLNSDPARQAILDPRPDALDDSNARRDWGWARKHGLEATSDDLVPKVRG